jgi:hypothetical protein
MNSRFDELLPFYVNGTLNEADRAWVDAYLREHPDADAELRWTDSLQRKLRDDVPAVSSEVGMERALKRIHSEGPLPMRARRAAAPSLADKLREFFASLVPQPMLKPALAGALAVVFVQAVVIANLADEVDEASEIRAMQGSVIEKGPYLKVNFKPDAREADIRLLLVEINGSLKAGPGQLGDYFVSVPEAQIAAVTQKLEGSGIVDAVAVVDALPERR